MFETGILSGFSGVVESGVALLAGDDFIIRQVEDQFLVAPNAGTGRSAFLSPAGIPEHFEFGAVQLREVAHQIEDAAAVAVVADFRKIVLPVTADAFQMGFDFFHDKFRFSFGKKVLRV